MAAIHTNLASPELPKDERLPCCPQCAGILEPDSRWLARVTNQSLAKTPTEEAH